LTAQWRYGATLEQLSSIRIDPTGELGGPRPIPEARAELNRGDGFEPTAEDRRMQARDTQLLGPFLIDKDAVFAGAVEAMERPQDIGTFPTASQLLQAAQTLAA
jgi:hypothetical protein